MKRKLCVIAVIICMALFCTACAKEVSFKDYSKDFEYTDPYPVLNTMEQLSDFQGLSIGFTYDSMITFTNQKNMWVYNSATDTTLLTVNLDTIYDYQFLTVADQTLITVITYDQLPSTNTPENEMTYTATVYNAQGSTVLTEQLNSATVANAFTVNNDLFEYCGKVYRVGSNGDVTCIISNPFFGKLPAFSSKAGEYYSIVTGSTLTVYDSALNIAMYWQIPNSEADISEFFMLGDNFVVQLSTALLDSESKYDFISEGTKYDIETLVIDPKAGKVTSVDADFIILSTDAAKSRAYIAPIENNRVLDSAAARQYVTLDSKNCKIESILIPEIDGTITMLVQDRFLYKTYSGDSYLIDSEGKIIGKCNALTADRNATFIVLDGKLYNYNLELVYDFTANDLVVSHILGHAVVFKDADTNLFLYTAANGLVDLNATRDELAWITKQFYALSKNGAFDIYGEDGTYIGTTVEGTKVTVAFTGADYRILSVNTVDKATGAKANVYYKLFQAPAN